MPRLLATISALLSTALLPVTFTRAVKSAIWPTLWVAATAHKFATALALLSTAFAWLSRLASFALLSRIHGKRFRTHLGFFLAFCIHQALRERADFAVVQFHVHAAAQTARQTISSVANTNQAAHGVAHRFKHAAHLAVAAFANRHAHPAVRTIATAIFNRQKLRRAIFKLNAIKQLLAILRRQFAQNAHRIFTAQTKARMCQAVGQLAGVGKQQQTFGIQIQAAYAEPFAKRQTRQAAKHRGPVLRIVIRHDLARRLVIGEHARTWLLNAKLQELALNAHLIAPLNTLAHMGFLAIDRDVAIGNHVFHLKA